jgi:hypothetical protein|tara:strand:+ start:347 stop:622 length:276 start_codon:yes stop_codon:yes gene_type:complete
MPEIMDGHAFAVFGSAAAYMLTANAVLKKGWVRRLAHQEPIVFGSCMLVGAAMLLPLTVIPIRRGLGMPTNQYDAFDHLNVVYPDYSKYRK